MEAGNIHYQVDIDTRELLRGERDANRALGSLDRDMQKVDRTSQQTSRSLSGLAKAISAAISVRQVVAYVDAWTNVQNQLRVVTDSQADLVNVSNQVVQITRETRASLEATSTLYSRFRRSVDDTVASDKELLDITRTINQILAVSGATAQESEGALRQLSQGLASGALRGEEFNSVAEQAPGILRAVSNYTGMAIGSLREFAAEGGITSEILMAALQDYAETAEREFAGSTQTMGQALQVAHTNATEFVGQTNALTSAVGLAGEGVVFLSENLDTLVNIATVLAAVYGGRMVQALAASTMATVTARIEAARYQLALMNMAGVSRVATTATMVLRGAMATLGGPAGLILLAASAFLIYGQNARDAAGETDLLTEAVNKLNNEQRDLSRIQTVDRLQELAKEARNTRATLDQLGRYRPSDNVNRALAEQRLALRENQDETARLQKRLQELANAGLPNPNKGSVRERPKFITPEELTEFEKLEQAMENQIALAKLSGAARAELSALQRLGSDATAEEVERIKQLSAELYNLEEAEKAAAQAVSDAKKASDEAIRSYEDNETVIQNMRDALNDAVLSEFELIEVQARRALNKDATAQQVAQVQALARATRQLKEEEKAREEAKKLREEATAADPRTAAADQYAQQLEAYKMYKEQELITDLQYLELKNAATTQYEQARLAAQEEIFRAQSAGNEFLMSSIDALGSASTEVMSGLLSGTMNTKEAFQTLGQAIFKEAIGALVQMGVQYVKNLIMGQTAAAAVTATSAGMAATLGTAWAAPAALASLATVGGNAGPAIAGISSTIGVAKGLSIMGGRMYGGPVQSDGLYRVNEGGKPEIFNAANGMQYMMPNQRGQVVSHADATGAAAGPRRPPIINIYESPRATVDVTPRQGLDGEDVIDIVVRDIMNDGRTRDAIGAVTGSTYQGD